MIKGYTYINLSLFPVYVNNAYGSSSNYVGVQEYNSSRWMSYANNSDLDNLHTLVRLSYIDKEEVLSNKYYFNYQLITDLFDIILTQSHFRSNTISESVDYILRKKEYPVDLTTDNRYTVEISKFHPQNNTIILIANPKSKNCKTLIEKRKRLNEYL